MGWSRSLRAFGHTRRVVVAAVVAFSTGLVVLVLAQGLSPIGPVRAIEEIALVALVVAALTGGMAFLAVKLAGWRNPESEAEFEELVRHSEELAREGLAVEPGEAEFMELDPLDDSDFEELVREALDDLPDLLRNALSHVAVVISNGGRIRPLSGWNRRPERHPRPDRDLQGHVATGLRPRRRGAAKPGDEDGAPRAGPSRRLRRAGRVTPGLVGFSPLAPAT
jgi:hypothetical protein